MGNKNACLGFVGRSENGEGAGCIYLMYGCMIR